MAEHNFQIFDESMADTMSDIDYQTDSQRTNGVIPGVANPLLHNKLYRQCSVMAFAIAQVLVARGYDANDSDPAALTNAIQRSFAFSVNGNVPNATGAITAFRPLDAWPIGSIFITASNADPATLLGGGTWKRIQGKYLLASSSDYTAGNTYGSMTKTLNVSNIPTHTHTFSTSVAGYHAHGAGTDAQGNHSHTRGSMNITGYFSNEALPGGATGGAEVGGAFYLSGSGRAHLQGSNYGAGNNNYVFDASRTWGGATSVTGAHTHGVTVYADGNHTHSGTTNGTGSGTAFNIMPESIAVNVWRRTA